MIRRELRVFPGQTFNRALLERSQRDVYMLNYFGNIEPSVIPVGEDKVDLVFKVEEKSTDTANMSAGWSERDRLIGQVGVAMANFLGNGQTISADANFGRYYKSYSLNFSEPWLLDSPTLVGVSLYSIRREPYYVGYRQVSDGGSVRFGRRLRWPDNFFRGDWIYQLDRTSLSNFSSYYQTYNPNGVVTEDWPLISSGFTQIINRNSLDRPEFPTAGSEFTLTTELVGTVMGGNVDFHKHTLRLDWFTPALWKLVFYTSFQAGYMEGLGKDAKFPTWNTISWVATVCPAPIHCAAMKTRSPVVPSSPKAAKPCSNTRPNCASRLLPIRPFLACSLLKPATPAGFQTR